MKVLSLLLVVGMVCVLPQAARADISLTVQAGVSSGTTMGPHTLLQCVGHSYVKTTSPFSQCTNMGAGLSMNFGTLTTRLLTPSGLDDGGAGCFYSDFFYIVYLYPDAWGGKGYEIKQDPGTAFSTAIANAVVMTPVYSIDDKYDGDIIGQGALLGTEVLGSPILAKNGGSILRARRARIVRAEYGIPPIPDPTVPTDTRPATWSSVPLTTAVGTYNGSVKITLSEF